MQALTRHAAVTNLCLDRRIVAYADIVRCFPRAGESLRRPGGTMTININNYEPLIALLAGVLILLVPRILNYVVAIYLIVIGILGLHILR
jgi:Protein of unknown function (DUF3096)